MNSDNDNDGTVFSRTGIPRKQTYKRRFPLPRKRFDRDHLNHLKNEFSQNDQSSSRHNEDNLRQNMKRFKNRNYRGRININHPQQTHRSVQNRIEAIRNNNSQNSKHLLVVGGSNNDEDAKNCNYNNSLDDSNDSIDLNNIQFNVSNFKNEKQQMDEDIDTGAVDDDDEQIDDAADITVQIRNDKVEKNTEDQLVRFKMILDGKTQYAIKKIQARNKQKQVIYPYPITPHQSGLTTHERFSML